MTSINKEMKIAIIGLGYVGLPLAIELGKKYSVVGFDKDMNRINDLKRYTDKTLEVKKEKLKSSNILFTNNKNDIIGAIKVSWKQIRVKIKDLKEVLTKLLNQEEKFEKSGKLKK